MDINEYRKMYEEHIGQAMAEQPLSTATTVTDPVRVAEQMIIAQIENLSVKDAAALRAQIISEIRKLNNMRALIDEAATR